MISIYIAEKKRDKKYLKWIQQENKKEPKFVFDQQVRLSKRFAILTIYLFQMTLNNNRNNEITQSLQQI